jgi:glycerate 2-kinase
VAIGKCAGGMLDGVAAVHDIRDALLIVPRGYPAARHARRSTMSGSHPLPDDSSFAAGERLMEFVREHDEILFLISGGGSACVEAPLAPWFTRDDVVHAGRAILDAGISIAEMNVVRKHLSAIKGGRLGALVRGRSHTLIYSDVATGDAAAVASGPTIPDSSTKSQAIEILTRVGGCDRIVTKLRDESLPSTVHHIDNSSWTIVADNSVLVRTAARVLEESGHRAVMIDEQIEGHVSDAARQLAARAAALQTGEVLVAGGEPTVVKHGSGKGGRCLELAVRYALERASTPALFGSSDGLDGNSGVAGAIVERTAEASRPVLEAALGRSDTLSALALIGRPIMIPPTGNNLRDLYLLARS